MSSYIGENNKVIKHKIFTKKSLASEIKRYAFMIIGCLSYALSLKMFLEPNGIAGGGVSGAASLIHILTSLPTGLFIAVINIPILIFGFKKMGWKFIVRCLITTGCLSLATEFWELILPNKIWMLEKITDDGILASLYGGLLQGLGIGLFIKYETSSGGTELLGRLTHGIIPLGTIATHVAVFDGLVVVLGAVYLGLQNILYALILIFVSAKISDLIVMGFSHAKLCYIITNKAEEISEFLISHSPRGVTLIQGEGMYTKSAKGVLLTCVKSRQIVSLKTFIKELDENAFVIVTEANEVYGKGFKRI